VLLPQVQLALSLVLQLFLPAQHSSLEVQFVWRCTCEEQGPRLPEQPQSPIGLDPVGELSGFPLVPCPYYGMARVVEGQTQKEGENHGRLYFKCARNSVSSLLCLPNLC
jgi:hypothetical protein